MVVAEAEVLSKFGVWAMEAGNTGRGADLFFCED